MADRIEFANPQFRPGVNVTVRDGVKWDMKVDRLPKTFEIGQTDGPTVGRAWIIGKMVVPAQSIPLEVLLLNHDPSCREPDGLVRGMRAAYGPTWNPSSQVTVLFFVVRMNER